MQTSRGQAWKIRGQVIIIVGQALRIINQVKIIGGQAKTDGEQHIIITYRGQVYIIGGQG